MHRTLAQRVVRPGVGLQHLLYPGRELAIALRRDRGRAILASDGPRPEVGHKVLSGIRKVLSGEVLLARSLLTSTQDNLASPLAGVNGAMDDVPIASLVS